MSCALSYIPQVYIILVLTAVIMIVNRSLNLFLLTEILHPLINISQFHHITYPWPLVASLQLFPSINLTSLDFTYKLKSWGTCLSVPSLFHLMSFRAIVVANGMMSFFLKSSFGKKCAAIGNLTFIWQECKMMQPLVKTVCHFI